MLAGADPERSFSGQRSLLLPFRPAGTSTLVDWNWNGIFGEEDVIADINYSHFTEIGPQRFNVGQAATAPVLVAHGEGSRSLAVVFRTAQYRRAAT